MNMTAYVILDHSVSILRKSCLTEYHTLCLCGSFSIVVDQLDSCMARSAMLEVGQKHKKMCCTATVVIRTYKSMICSHQIFFHRSPLWHYFLDHIQWNYFIFVKADLMLGWRFWNLKFCS